MAAGELEHAVSARWRAVWRGAAAGRSGIWKTLARAARMDERCIVGEGRSTVVACSR